MFISVSVVLNLPKREFSQSFFFQRNGFVFREAATDTTNRKIYLKK